MYAQTSLERWAQFDPSGGQVGEANHYASTRGIRAVGVPSLGLFHLDNGDSMDSISRSGSAGVKQLIRPERPAQVERQVKFEQVRLLYHNIPVAAAGSLAAAVILAALLWNSVSHRILIAWMMAAISVISATLLGYLANLRADHSEKNKDGWATLSTALAFLGGCVWGSAGFLLFELKGPESQGLLILTLALVSVGGAVTYAPHLPSVYAHVVPISLMLATSLGLQGDLVYRVLSVATLILLLFVARLAQRSNNMLAKAHRLSFRNLELVRELTIHKDLAEKANHAKTRFLAAASHDLRQPMHAMGLFVGALRDKIQYPEVRTIVDGIQASVDAMDSLLGSLLDMSKLEAGSVTPQLSDFYVQNLLDRMELEYGSQARNKGIDFRVMPCKLIVHTDPALLDRIVRNLVSNAVRHTSSGRVVIGCRRRGDRLRIEAWDTGRGIPAERLEDIFQEFFQLGNVERDRRKGLGLGLSIVKRLAELLEHRVEVRSVLGNGSCFSVHVPLGGRQETADQASPDPSRPKNQIFGSFIVVVDDDEDVLAGMDALLSQWGCHVLTATSGVDAVTKLAQHQRVPDLIISDYRLRGNELGTDVVVKIRAAQEETIPALLVTGDTAPERVKEAAASGFPLLHKPVSAQTLRLVLTTILTPGDSGQRLNASEG